jgi:hypothetical protein
MTAGLLPALAIDAEGGDPDRTIAVPAPLVGDDAFPTRQPGTHLPRSVRLPAPAEPDGQSHAVGKGLTATRPGLHRVDQRIEPLSDGTWFAICGAHVEPISDAYGGPWCLVCWPSVEFEDAPSQALMERVLAGLRAYGTEPPTLPIPAASPPWPNTEDPR